MLSCGTSNLGTRHYTCSNASCTHTKNIHITCKSRLCNSCGQKATEKWIANQGEILPDCKWRHITFTMPDDFWAIFKKNRTLLNPLFSLAANGLLQQAKKQKLTIGLFAALHTYGRQLNFNTHIHLSLANIALNTHGKIKPFRFPFSTLMSQWRYEVINLLRQAYQTLILPSSLDETIHSYQDWNAYLNQQYNKSWIVNIQKKATHKNQTKNYIGRYLKKPPIAASRLRHYIGGDVVFNYLDHRTKTMKKLTLSQEEMLIRILSHVPEKHFKMIRYYGFLSNRLRGDNLPKIYEQLGQTIKPLPTLSYAAMMKQFLNVDPYRCILCHSRMIFSRFNRGIPLNHLMLAIKEIAALRIISL